MNAAELLGGGAIAFVVALITTPAGVSGAVLLLPIQNSVLHVPNPALTPTNLLYNVLSTPGALGRFASERRASNSLTPVLLVGTVPGVIVGAALRGSVLSGPRTFLGLCMGTGGILGSYLGARWQRHVSEQCLRRLLGAVCVALAARYGLQGLQGV